MVSAQSVRVPRCVDVVAVIVFGGMLVDRVRRTVVVMAEDLVMRARPAAEALLASLPRRWAHVQGVAARAAEVAPLLVPERADEIVAACWLHDIGYASEVAVTGFHPVDGAHLAVGLNFPPLVVSLIAFHTGASFEAAERGLSHELAAFDAPPRSFLDVVTFADLTTSVDGAPIGANARVTEILTRYEPDDPVHRAVSASAPSLLAGVARVESRLAALAGRS